jgi:hypothetical protein
MTARHRAVLGQRPVRLAARDPLKNKRLPGFAQVYGWHWSDLCDEALYAHQDKTVISTKE